MKKQAWISKGLYAEGLRRAKVTSFIFLAYILLVEVIIPFIQGLTDSSNLYSTPTTVGAWDVVGWLLVIPYLWAPIQTLVLFYAFNKRNTSDFYQSLPFARKTVFCSWGLAILTLMIGGLFAGTFAGWLVRVIFPKAFAVNLWGLWPLLLSTVAAILFAVACTMIAVSVTGTLLSNLACTLLIMFLPRLIIFVVREMVISKLPLLSENWFLPALSLRYNMFVSFVPANLIRSSTVGRQLYLSGTEVLGPDLYTIVLSLLYFVLGCILFCYRKSETAEHSASSRKVQAVIRIAIGFTISMIGTCFLFDATRENVMVALIFYIIAIIVFLVYELLTTHKWKNLIRVLPTLLIVLALNLAIFGGIRLAQHSVLSRTLAPEDIRSVSVMDETANQYDYWNRQTGAYEIENPEVFREVATVYARDIEAVKDDRYYLTDGKYYRVVAIRTTGGTLYRKLGFTAQEFGKISQSMAASESYRNLYMQLPPYLPDTMEISLTSFGGGGSVNQLTADGEKALYETLQNEIRAIGFETWYVYANTAVENEIAIRASLSYTEDSKDQLSVTIPVLYETLPKTFMQLMKTLYEAQDLDVVAEALQDPTEYFSADMTLLERTADGVADASYYYDSEEELAEENAEGIAPKELLQAALDATEGQLPKPDRFMLVNFWWSKDGYDVSRNLLLPIPEGIRIENGAAVFSK